MVYSHPTKFLFCMLSVLPLSSCTIDVNTREFQYLSDHLTQEECRKLVAALHFDSYDIPRQIVGAERKLPEDLSCLELLLHWNSAAGEGKGGTHVEICQRLTQIGRQDLAEWLSKTVFHQLSKDLDESMTLSVTEETGSRPPRVARHEKQNIRDEAPWLTLDSVLAFLVVLAVGVFLIGVFYLLCECCFRIGRRQSSKKYAGEEKSGREILREGQETSNLPSSEDETAKLITKSKSSDKN